MIIRFKIFEDINIDNDVKKGDYVIFIDRFDDLFVKRNYPYIVDSIVAVEPRGKIGFSRVYLACITCDDYKIRSFRAKNSTLYIKISNEEAEILLSANKYNL